MYKFLKYKFHRVIVPDQPDFYMYYLQMTLNSCDTYKLPTSSIREVFPLLMPTTITEQSAASVTPLLQIFSATRLNRIDLILGSQHRTSRPPGHNWWPHHVATTCLTMSFSMSPTYVMFSIAQKSKPQRLTFLINLRTCDWICFSPKSQHMDRTRRIAKVKISALRSRGILSGHIHIQYMDHAFQSSPSFVMHF